MHAKGPREHQHAFAAKLSGVGFKRRGGLSLDERDDAHPN